MKDHNINNVLITIDNKRGQGHSGKIRKVPHIPDNQPGDFISICIHNSLHLFNNHGCQTAQVHSFSSLHITYLLHTANPQLAYTLILNQWAYLVQILLGNLQYHRIC